MTPEGDDRPGVLVDRHLLLIENGDARPTLVARDRGNPARRGTDATPVDVRVTAMTNRDVWEQVADGRIRRDLIIEPACRDCEVMPGEPTPAGKPLPRRATERPTDHTLADLERDHIAQDEQA